MHPNCRYLFNDPFPIASDNGDKRASGINPINSKYLDCGVFVGSDQRGENTVNPLRLARRLRKDERRKIAESYISHLPI
jgi:hypothetical protein